MPVRAGLWSNRGHVCYRNNKINATLSSILLATTLGGVISISAAAFLSYGLLSRMVERMVSLSVGILLSSSLLHALPEAFESDANIHALFATLLGGLLGFFLLEKMAILRHSHHTRATVMIMSTGMMRMRPDRPVG